MTEITKEETRNPSLWQYEVVAAFNDVYYDKVLTKKDIVGSEKMVKNVIVFEQVGDTVIEKEVAINGYYFVLKKDMKQYLLESDKIHTLPLIVKEYAKVGYNKDAFLLISRSQPVGFRPERKYSFRQIVDNFAYFEHSNGNHFKLWKIIAFTAYLGRINVRISSEPAFGKDSIIALMDDLVGSVGVVQKPTIAKLEYLTLANQLLLVNEFMNLSSQETKDIEQYLLTVGDFKNKYQKRSRASATMGGSEEYNISKFSVMLAYNTLTDYPDGEKEYFDFVHTNQLKQRFLPLKFSGKLTHVFQITPDSKSIASEHKDFYVGMAKSINYYAIEDNLRKELKPYPKIEFDFKDRWKVNFDTIAKFINLYANDEKEYKKLINDLYTCHVNYMEMVNKGNSDLNRKYYVKTSAGEMDEEPALIEEFLEE